MKDLNELRKRIDSIDDTIARLLDMRFDVVRDIGEVKKSQNIAIENKDREKEVIAHVKKQASTAENAISIVNVYRTIISESKKNEK